MTARPSGVYRSVLGCAAILLLLIGKRDVLAQGRDPVWNGAIIGAAVGAATGAALTHGVRDSDLAFSQYMQGALIFGAMGAAVGLGLDALLSRTSPGPRLTPPRFVLAPAVWRDVAGAFVSWRW